MVAESSFVGILQRLEPLFQEANREKKWFASTYQGMIFSPKELRKHHKNGELIWGPSNWTLVAPPNLIDTEAALQKIREDNRKLADRIADGWE